MPKLATQEHHGNVYVGSCPVVLRQLWVTQCVLQCDPFLLGWNVSWPTGVTVAPARRLHCEEEESCQFVASWTSQSSEEGQTERPVLG